MTSTPPAGELNDDALAQEIDLLADLVLAAGGVDRALTEPEVDLALGLHPQRDTHIREQRRGGLVVANEARAGHAMPPASA
jgi:hypothetical protein